MYRVLFSLLLVRIPAETAHHLALVLLRLMGTVPGLVWLLDRLLGPRDPALEVEALGLRFRSPLGLAAGLDKDALAWAALAALGFGFIEIGTVTGHPQPGNPRPRLFRLPRDRALVNRMGFNNCGSVVVAERLRRRRGRRVVVGANIGRTKAVPDQDAIADYVTGARRLAPVADYLVVNVSSPNTPGLRDLQAVERLRPLLVAVREAAGRTPVLVKIAPDLADGDVDAVADLCLELGLDGIVATNTTVSRAGLLSDPAEIEAAGVGGLSGPPLRARSLEVLRRLRARVGTGLVLISVGGIETAEHAWERIEAGATLVQAYTAFVYEGPLWPSRLNRGLSPMMRQAEPAS